MSDKNPSRQAALALALLLLGFVLAACGKKPGSVDPPPGAENQKFPLVYPDPNTYPKN